MDALHGDERRPQVGDDEVEGDGGEQRRAPLARPRLLPPRNLNSHGDQNPADPAPALAPVLVVAGEAFTRATLERWRALAPGTRLINVY
ncbi:hypothetical protein PUR28_00050, partial [Streptomyces sp. BE308]|uniref:hypothetical protein n=1 Tax=Streptomyces sp. BE308 TaxID=3002529 RepID=UPI002E76C037